MSLASWLKMFCCLSWWVGIAVCLGYSQEIKPRQLSFDMIFAPDSERLSGVTDPKPHQIFVDNKPIRCEDTFLPGKHHIKALFCIFRTVEKHIDIPAGEGAYVVELEVFLLEKYELRIYKKYADMTGCAFVDGIKYSLEIYADDRLVEPHQICFEGSPGSLMYLSYYAAPNSKTVCCASGFYYDESPAKPTLQFRSLTKIDTARLINHLQQVLAMAGQGNRELHTLQILEALLNMPETKKKFGTSQDIQQLLDYLKKQDFSTHSDIRYRLVQTLLSWLK